MTSKLIFNLPEEEELFNHAKNGLNYYCALEETFRLLRNNKKYEQGKDAEKLYGEFLEILSYRYIDI